MIKIYGKTTVYRIYTVNREPIRLPEIQYPVFWHKYPLIQLFQKRLSWSELSILDPKGTVGFKQLR